jgi:lipopolysaccharide biosynthesis regulator YciM
MSTSEQALLFVLIAFIAGVALGRFWERLAFPGRPSSRKRIGESIHYILGLDYLASRQIDRAIAELTLAARADTEAVEIYLILGNLLREKGQLERAIQIHQSILHRPGLPAREKAHALLCLGIDFKRAGFRNRAMETLEEVVRLDPGDPYATLYLLKIHEEEHDWEKALALQQKLDALGGESDSTLTAFLHDQIGQTATAASNENLASRSFDAAIRYGRKLAPPYLHLGDLLERQGRLSEAVNQWETLLREVPEQAYLAFDRLGKLYEKMGEPVKLERLYIEVMNHDPKDWRAHLELARKRLQEGKSSESFHLLERAAVNNPHAIGLHLEALGLLLEGGASTEDIRSYLGRVRESTFFFDPHVCTKCHYRANGILWRCPHCQEWNTFVEERLGAPEA